MGIGPAMQQCPSCQKRLRVPSSAAGKRVRCPSCRADFSVSAEIPAALPVPIRLPVPPAENDPFDFYAADDRPAPKWVNAAPAYFTAVEPRVWTTNRMYRVYVAGDELVGVWIGKGNDLALAVGAGGGLIGGLIGGVIAAKNAAKNKRRQDELESRPLEEIRDTHPHNFAITAGDVDDAEVVRPSFWFRLNHAQVPQFGLLRLNAAGERRTLAIATAKDLEQAIHPLKKLLGDRLRVKVDYRRSQ
ncbi:hypothetical protein J8F10_01055 [Gemmata sp. G18]|uniref:Zinc finger/thioredoxin putative domain-containing protein n=1 Tax=Gemmata palustris TaxID=2822762 RepID=A0ABS5BJK5_9BACT|nr:hypothetical protein [Gemmata palustris]MBP3953889.1 hypothetical protein [Gemmata palustris]